MRRGFFVFLAMLIVPVGCADDAVVGGSASDGEVLSQLEDVAGGDVGETTEFSPVSKDGGQTGSISDGVETSSDGVETSSDGVEDVSVGEPLPCAEGESCDDGNPCSTSDLCQDGICAGSEVVCDDGIPCTVDSCGSEGECRSVLSAGNCLIEETCYAGGALHPEASCQVCVPSLQPEQWSNQDLAACDDGDACTEGDRCVSGLCAPLGPLTCTDGNPCTEDSCAGDVGCVYAFTEAPCTDGNPCSLGDACAQGECEGGKEVLFCADGNPCTDDECGELGCVFTANAVPCDDGNPCTDSGSCSEAACEGGPPLELACDDVNPCTDSACDPNFGCVYIANTIACDDGEPCSLNDACENTQCEAGAEAPTCDDGNSCTTDSCSPGSGCVFLDNFEPCDDGSVCTTTDLCGGGACVGQAPLDCADGNSCTDESCDSANGCAWENNTDACDDGSLCTLSDGCLDGSCAGIALECDDGNPCTSDGCLGTTGTCISEAIVSNQCVPFVIILTPLRGEGLGSEGSLETFEVTGEYGTPAGVGETLILTHSSGNGVVIEEDLLASGAANGGNFSFVVSPQHGLNHVSLEIVDSVGGSALRTHSFFYSSEWLAPDETGFKDEGLVILMDQEVIDDGDRSLPVNDLGTVFEIVAQSVDLGAFLANGEKIATQSIPILGDVDIYAEKMTYDGPFVSLESGDGKLFASLLLTNVKVDLKFVYEACIPFFGCDDVVLTGDATAQSVVVDTEILFSVDPNTGELIATTGATSSTLSSFEISMDGSLSFLLDFVLGFFNETFAAELEAVVDEKVAGLLPDIISAAFSSLALSETFSFPPLFGGDNTVEVVFESFLSSLDFLVEGAAIGMMASANPESPLPKISVGSFGRANCLDPGEGTLLEDLWASFFPQDSLGIALHDDVFNRLLYAVWLGGGLQFPVSDEVLAGTDLSSLGIEELDVFVEFLAPPVVNSCTPSGDLEIQIGDLGVFADLTLGSIPLVVDIYVSLRAAAEFSVVENGGSQELGLGLKEVSDLKIDLVFADPGQSVFSDALILLIEEELVPIFLGTLTEGAIGGFPLPSIDLSAIDGIPAGTALELDLKEVLRVGGYSLLKGDVK